MEASRCVLGEVSQKDGKLLKAAKSVEGEEKGEEEKKSISENRLRIGCQSRLWVKKKFFRSSCKVCSVNIDWWIRRARDPPLHFVIRMDHSGCCDLCKLCAHLLIAFERRVRSKAPESRCLIDGAYSQTLAKKPRLRTKWENIDEFGK